MIRKLSGLVMLLFFVSLNVHGTPRIFLEHDGISRLTSGTILLSGIAEEQLLGGTQDNILDGFIKTVDELNEYEEVLKKIEEQQEDDEAEAEKPAVPVAPEEPEPPSAPATLETEPEEPDPEKESVSPTPVERTTRPEAPAGPEVIINTRAIMARPGDSISLSLKGRGWIYIGEQRGRVGIEFRGRESGSEETSFTLYAEDLGEYSLQFQLQDLSAGKIYIEEINAKVLPDDEFEKALTGAKAGVELTSSGTGDYASARRMAGNGRLEDALEEFQRQYQEGDPGVNQEIAALAYNINRYDIARRYWIRNLDDETGYGDEALTGMVKSAVALEDQKDYDTYIGDYLEIRHPEKGEILISAAYFQEKLGNFREAVTLLEESLLIDPYGLYADQACYRLGVLFESQSSLRDIQKAVDFYSRVKDEFPGSIYYDESRNRIDYLNRHFLQIR